jgi:hypothetical protein
MSIMFKLALILYCVDSADIGYCVVLQNEKKESLLKNSRIYWLLCTIDNTVTVQPVRPCFYPNWM